MAGFIVWWSRWPRSSKNLLGESLRLLNNNYGTKYTGIINYPIGKAFEMCRRNPQSTCSYKENWQCLCYKQELLILCSWLLIFPGANILRNMNISAGWWGSIRCYEQKLSLDRKDSQSRHNLRSRELPPDLILRQFRLQSQGWICTKWCYQLECQERIMHGSNS